MNEYKITAYIFTHEHNEDGEGVFLASDPEDAQERAKIFFSREWFCNPKDIRIAESTLVIDN